MTEGLVRTRPERRKKTRIAFTHGLIARFGTPGVVLIDASETGVRIEHFTRLDVGRQARLRFDWEQRLVETEAIVVWCRVHRFTHGEGGVTVFQSGLHFALALGASAATIHEMITISVARSLAEQVANARGIGPVTQRTMPVFRSGVVAASGLETARGGKQRLLPDAALVVERGYVRCSLVRGRWDKKWSRSPEQPEEGFTVPGTESPDHIDSLCETYQKLGPDDRRVIQLMARLSVERVEETPEPRADSPAHGL